MYNMACRNKTITLERLKRSILNEVRSGDQEGRCLAQYKREMELLQQEKMSHVEELRQIHADINAVCNLSFLIKLQSLHLLVKFTGHYAIIKCNIIII